MLFSDTARTESPRPPTTAEAAALGFTSSLGPFAVNAYVPGFHRMAEDFSTSLIHIEQSLTVYLVSYAVFSIVAGTISDALGRKRTLMGGMVLFVVASIGALLSESLAALFFWRILQGMGAAVGQVVTQAIVRDRWSGAHAARMNGLIAMFFALSPAFAPIVGGWIIALTSWHAVFVFLALYAAGIVVFTRFYVAETLPEACRTPMAASAVLQGYRTGFSHGAFMAGVVSHGFCFMGGILYSAGAADYVITIMGLDLHEFAWYTIPTTAFTLAGAWGSSRLLRFVAGRTMVCGASVFCMLLMLAAASVEYFAGSSFAVALAGPCLYWFAASLARPVMMAMNLDYFPKNRGLAAAIQQFFVTASFSVCSALWVPIVLGESWKYACVTAFCSIMMLATWLVSMHLRPAALAGAGVREEM